MTCAYYQSKYCLAFKSNKKIAEYVVCDFPKEDNNKCSKRKVLQRLRFLSLSELDKL